MYEKLSNKLLPPKILQNVSRNWVILSLFFIFPIEMIVSDSNYQVITVQGDTLSYPQLAYICSYTLASLPRTNL